MKQFILDQFPDVETGQLKLGKKDKHYLIDVRRLGTADTVDVLLPNGIKASGTILSIGQHDLVMQISNQTLALPADSDPQVHLGLSLLKGQKLDQVIRQATEIGVATLSFFESEHSIAKLSENSKLERWQNIIREASQQSGAKTIPQIFLYQKPIIFIKHFTETYTGHQLAFCHEKQLADSSVHEYCSHDSDHFGLMIGPEGGFSKNEVENFVALGGQPLYLGSQVLRAETAAIFGLSVLKTLFLERNKWLINQP